MLQVALRLWNMTDFAADDGFNIQYLIFKVWWLTGQVVCWISELGGELTDLSQEVEYVNWWTSCVLGSLIF